MDAELYNYKCKLCEEIFESEFVKETHWNTINKINFFICEECLDQIKILVKYEIEHDIQWEVNNTIYSDYVSNIDKKFKLIEESINAHALGVQNVYNEVNKIRDKLNDVDKYHQQMQEIKEFLKDEGTLNKFKKVINVLDENRYLIVELN